MKQKTRTNKKSASLREIEYDEMDKKVKVSKPEKNSKAPLELQIKEFKWTEKQQRFIDLCLDRKSSYVFNCAPAGVGKSLMSLYIGLRLLNEGRIKTIVFCRQPVESSSFTLGFLKGDLAEKFLPYIQSALNLLEELLNPPDIKKLMDGGFFESIPIGHLKGLSFHNALVICEEAEDLLREDFRLCMTRLGKHSKMLFIGDSEQSNVKKNSFKEIVRIFDHPDCEKHGIHCFYFEPKDIMRNKEIAFVLERLALLDKPTFDKKQVLVSETWVPET
jgi:phosphate starvation-inducible protein PhoH and related proteins